MEKYTNRILYVKDLFFKFMEIELKNNSIENIYKYRLQNKWLKLDLDYIKVCKLDYFYNILEEQSILNWRLDENIFTEYNNYYYELIILILDIILE
ncbi:hypothetical protein AMV126 [Betaentomopoxvirus amoorei]|uniref:AMV126 n=1 Tax=Amsacta moorei entomopoxvirus TaxID=28321 RepID=Q9EMS3_AMEPV|nr:hypothetical protein AMV126 [Amsacta moorei entomopoxvirus]AAG02832.1 AMV126 [Amsacta moorei entomopoxvirus]